MVNPGVWFGLLGPLEARLDDRPLELGGRRQRSVLAMLLLTANHVVSLDRLIEGMWDEAPPPRAVGAVQTHMSNLRRALAPLTERLGREVVETRPPGYVVSLVADQLDLLQFEEHLQAARSAVDAGDPAAAFDAYESALGTWRGDPLADVAGEPFARSAVARLEGQRHTAVLGRLEAGVACGRHQAMLDELQHVAAQHPLDERVCGLVMVALYRAGRQSDALAAYRTLRTALVEELGLDPGSELRELERRILDQDPTLGETAPVGRDLASTVRREAARRPDAWLVAADRRHGLVDDPTTIGRRSDNTISLDDPLVSRAHAELRRRPDGWELVDLGSANGTLLNGEPVERADLAAGDVIGIGDTELRFVSGS
jgi:DNA-binding SARP family transcriptional activator